MAKLTNPIGKKCYIDYSNSFAKLKLFTFQDQFFH